MHCRNTSAHSEGAVQSMVSDTSSYATLDGTILLGRERQEIADALGVAPLVVVPRDELDEVLVERDTSLSIEDGAGSAAGEVSRDDLVLGVVEDALHGTSGGFLDSVLDLLVRSRLLETDNEIDDGDIDGGDTEGETGELAVQAGDDLADGLGGTSRRRDDVVADGTATTPVLVRGTVDGALGGSRGVDGGHETLDNAELVVDDLGKGRKAVGRA